MNKEDNYVGKAVKSPREDILIALKKALEGGNAELTDCYEVLSASVDGNGSETLIGFTSFESFLKAKGISLRKSTNAGRFRVTPHLGIRYPNPNGKGNLLAIIRLFTEDVVDDEAQYRRSALAKLTDEEKHALGLGGLQ